MQVALLADTQFQEPPIESGFLFSCLLCSSLSIARGTGMSEFKVVEIIAGSADRKVFQVYFGSKAFGDVFTTREQALAFMHREELLEEARRWQQEVIEKKPSASPSMR